MQEIIDPASADVLGYRLTDEEKQTALFALRLFSRNLDNGLIPTDDMDYETYVTGKETIDELVSDLEEDLDTVLDHNFHAISQVFLPYVCRLHDGITSPEMYQGVCNILEVTPFELFSNALTARSMINNDTVAI